jgi:hypothetical protein
MAKLPKAIYKLNAIPIKIVMTFFTKIEKSQNSYGNKRLQIAKAILSKNNNAGIIMMPDFKLSTEP